MMLLDIDIFEGYEKQKINKNKKGSENRYKFIRNLNFRKLNYELKSKVINFNRF